MGVHVAFSISNCVSYDSYVPCLHHSKEHREKVKTDNPDLSFGGVGKKLGEMWRALSDKEKEEYKTRKA